MQKKTVPSGTVSLTIRHALLAMLMLIATAAFIVVAHPPVSVADLLMAADASTRQPKNGTQEDAQNRAVREILWQVELRKLV